MLTLTDRRKKEICKEAFSGYRDPNFNLQKFINEKAFYYNVNTKIIKNILGDAEELNVVDERHDPKAEIVRLKFRNRRYEVALKDLKPIEN